jgi:hypothetical protein
MPVVACDENELCFSGESRNKPGSTCSIFCCVLQMCPLCAGLWNWSSMDKIWDLYTWPSSRRAYNSLLSRSLFRRRESEAFWLFGWPQSNLVNWTTIERFTNYFRFLWALYLGFSGVGHILATQIIKPSVHVHQHYPHATRSHMHTGSLVIATTTPSLWLIPPRD